VNNCDAPNSKYRDHFEQPVLQTLQMFIGEMGCWLVIGAYSLYQNYTSRRAGYEAIGDHEGVATPALSDDSETADIANPLKPAHPDEEGRLPLQGRTILLLALPACCDIAGTTLMNVGLLFVAASIYQMTRGALVLFVGLFSVWFLKRHLGLYKWFSLFVVVTGVAIVGLAGAITRDDKATPSHAAFYDAASEVVGNNDRHWCAADCWCPDLHGDAVRPRGAHHGEVRHGADKSCGLGRLLRLHRYAGWHDHPPFHYRHWIF
jgi:hypothetical protein